MFGALRSFRFCCQNKAVVATTLPTRFIHTDILASLHDNPAALRKNVKRLGRGPGSGKGKTAGRGHKGQKARSGNGAPRGFEGGQTPISRLFPKVGFTNSGQEVLSPLNLDRLQYWVKQGRIDPSKPITMKHLLDSRVIHGVKDGVKLLGGGKDGFHLKIDIDVTKASADAIKAVEDNGGTIVCTYRNKLSLRQLLKPESMKRPIRDALPTRRKDVEYYSLEEKRGYLVEKIKRGEFIVPVDPIERVRNEKETIKVTA